MFSGRADGGSGPGGEGEGGGGPSPAPRRRPDKKNGPGYPSGSLFLGSLFLEAPRSGQDGAETRMKKRKKNKIAIGAAGLKTAMA